jgi:hypothetical protein
VQLGHDVGFLIPHWSAPNPCLAAAIAFSKCQVHFAKSTVLVGGKLAGYWLPGIAMFQVCADPVSLPVGFNLNFYSSTVKFGFSWGDQVAGLVRVGIDIALSQIARGIFGKVARKLARRLAGRLMRSKLGDLSDEVVERIAYRESARWGDDAIDEIIRHGRMKVVVDKAIRDTLEEVANKGLREGGSRRPSRARSVDRFADRCASAGRGREPRPARRGADARGRGRTAMNGPVCALVETQRGFDLSVLVRRTYDIRGDGTCVEAEAQLPLEVEPDDGEIGFDVSWRGELDVAPHKPMTDLVVFGHAHARDRWTTEMIVSVALPRRDYVKRVLVVGDRRCSVGPGGQVRFSRPEPFERVPLCWTRAYGGVAPYDAAPPPSETVLDLYRRIAFPGNNYPRNPIGRGWALRNQSAVLDGLELPTLEDPSRRLTVDDAFPRSADDWHRQPIPASFGWVDAGWFPRCAYAGAAPVPDAPDRVEEVRCGYLPESWKRLRAARDIDARFFNAASPGLAVPYLAPGEPIELRGMDPTGRAIFRMPAPPACTLAVGSSTLSATWVAHTALVLADERQLVVTWCARTPLPRQSLPKVLFPAIDVAEAVGLTMTPADPIDFLQRPRATAEESGRGYDAR